MSLGAVELVKRVVRSCSDLLSFQHDDCGQRVVDRLIPPGAGVFISNRAPTR
jgi:hypothetical protein